MKKVTQQSLILSKMAQFEMLKENQCYIELGAGKGGLTERIAQSHNESKFIIIDRATSRVKKRANFEMRF